jgi:hypothetical protein
MANTGDVFDPALYKIAFSANTSAADKSELLVALQELYNTVEGKRLLEKNRLLGILGGDLTFGWHCSY